MLPSRMLLCTYVRIIIISAIAAAVSSYPPYHSSVDNQKSTPHLGSLFSQDIKRYCILYAWVHIVAHWWVILPAFG